MNTVKQPVSRDQIFSHLRSILVEKFELQEGAVTLDAHLYEGLDIDSIDAVDILASLKEYTGEKIDPETFKKVRTVGDIVEAVFKLLNRPG